MNKKKLSNIIFYLLLAVSSVIVFFPVVYAISASFMTNTEVILGKIVPSEISFENYRRAMGRAPLVRFFINSVIISTVGTIGQLIICSLAAYNLVFIKSKLNSLVFTFILATMFIPSDAIFISNYLTILNLDMLNTKIAMIVVGLTSATGIFFMVQSFKVIPRSLIEAAEIDGASEFKIYKNIVMPLSKTTLSTWGIFAFLGYWNAYLWPLMVTTRPESRTIQIGLKMMLAEEGAANAWGVIMAAVAIVLLPSLIVVFLGQKNIEKSLTAGAVKE